MLLSTLLPGVGLGLLKGMFLAELLKKPSKGKGYGHGGYGHHKRQLLVSPPQYHYDYSPSSLYQEYQPAKVYY